MIYDVCIVGAGASGMTAAIATARQGASVLIIERLDKSGKKILATGNGRCNMTNLRIQKGKVPEGSYYGGSEKFVMSVLQQFDAEDTRAFFESLSVFTHDRDGYVYPLSDQASTVADALRWEMASLGVDLVYNIVPERITHDKYFRISCSQNRSFQSRHLILSCGGKSQSKLGSDGTGYRLAKSFGHHIISPVPALCALQCTEKYFKDLAGIRLQGKISLYSGRQFLAADQGEIQLTAYGVSGIPVFQVSRYASYGLLKGEKITAVLDLMPEYSSDHMTRILAKLCEQHPDWTVKMILSGIMNKKLANVITSGCHISPETDASQLSTKDIMRITELMKGMHVHIKAVNDFEQSQVTAGGVDLHEIKMDLSSKLERNLYITGELLDVDGICGGYNLQWAWATGYIAGTAAGRRH